MAETISDTFSLEKASYIALVAFRNVFRHWTGIFILNYFEPSCVPLAIFHAAFLVLRFLIVDR